LAIIPDRPPQTIRRVISEADIVVFFPLVLLEPSLLFLSATTGSNNGPSFVTLVVGGTMDAIIIIIIIIIISFSSIIISLQKLQKQYQGRAAVVLQYDL